MHAFFTSATGIGLTLSVIIFLITLILVATRAIGFWITLLFLLFSLLVGVTVANNDAIREFLKCQKRYEQLLQAVEELKEEVETIKIDEEL